MSFNVWKEVPLGEILNFRRGHDLPISKMNKGVIPVVGSNGVIGYHNEFTTPAPCLTIGRSGNIGNPHFLNENSWAHNTTLYVDDFKGNDPRFLYYLLKTLRLNEFGGGSAVPTLNRNHIHPLKVKYPNDLTEQKAIAHVLSTLDDKIEVNNRINKVLEDMAQAIFKRWFVDFEFPNEEGEPYKSSGGEMVESELGMIPRGWRVGSLNSVANITMGQSPKGHSFNEIGNGEIFYQGRTDFTFRFPLVRLYTNEPTRFAEKNDALLSVRAPVGDVNVAVERCCIGRGLAAISSKFDLNSYLLYLIKALKPSFDVFNGEGTVFGSINQSSLRNMKIIISNDLETERVFNASCGIDNMIKNKVGENRNLEKMRDTLLPKLMSGDIRVPVEES